MSTDADDRRVDDKGRVTIPHDIREALGLKPGGRVAVSVEDGRVVVRPSVSRESFVETMEGCIDQETRRPDADSVDPLDLSGDWTEDLP